MSTTELVTLTNPKNGEVVQYAMDSRLKFNLDINAKEVLEKKDKDLFIVVDGTEGSGKSTLALQIGKYVDPSLDLDRVVFDAESFRQAVFKAKKNQCIVFDEAFNGLSSRASLSAMNKVLVGLMMQMRQKNLFIIMVLPTFFMLERYVALFRTKALVHVYEVGGVRGYFRVYNQKLKKILYLIGKKDYSYNDRRVRTKFRGRFYGKFALGDEEMDKKYRKKKMKALESTSQDPMSAGQIKYKEQRDLLIYLFRRESKMTYQQLGTYLEDYNFSISYQQIAKVCSRFGDISSGKEEKKQIEKKKDKKEKLQEKDEEEESKIEIIEEDEEEESKIEEIDEEDEIETEDIQLTDEEVEAMNEE
jgi:adenylate kinase family enzyme